MTEYYDCITLDDGVTQRYCGIQQHVSSREELLPCVMRKDEVLCHAHECAPVQAPPSTATALVYVVFGVKGIDKTSVDLRHVLRETEVTLQRNEPQ